MWSGFSATLLVEAILGQVDSMIKVIKVIRQADSASQFSHCQWTCR